ncbi:MAG: hypothetical protein U9Q92_04275 [archaeon]|nr:hypothetical protein [archaeon]
MTHERKRRRVEFKVDEKDSKFPYTDVGSETHGGSSYRLWLSGRFVEPRYTGKDIEEGEYGVLFPAKGLRVEKTEKGSYVLRPNDKSLVHDIFVNCGFRGGSSINILEPEIGKDDIFTYREYRSELGNLGISEGMLVNVPEGAVVKYRWTRSGRLYGNPSEGVIILMPDGSESNFEEIPDGLEAMAELPHCEK